MTELPATWRQMTLDDVAAWGSGGTPKAGTSAYYGGEIPWAIIGDLNDGLVAKTSASITEAGLRASSAKWVPAGAVLVAMYGSIGKLGLTGIALTTNQAIAAARPNDLVTARYLFLYLMSQRDELTRAGKGATQQNIGQGTLKAWPIPVPPLDEQQRIVEVVEDLLSRLNAGVNYLDAVQRRLDSMDSALFEHAEELRGADEVVLDSLLAEKLINGRSVITADTGFPVLRLTAMRDGRIDLGEQKIGNWSAEDAAGFVVAKDDVLITRGNGSIRLVGRAARVVDEPEPVAFPDTMIRIRADREKVLPEYLVQAWNSRYVRRQIESVARTTAGIYKISQKDLRKIMLPVPSQEAQRNLIGRLAEQSGSVRRLRVQVDLGLRRSNQLRASVLAAAFSGRLTDRVPDLEQVQEMADALT